MYSEKTFVGIGFKSSPLISETISSSKTQSTKALSPIGGTFPIEVNVEGNTSFLSLPQPLNAFFPIVVTVKSSPSSEILTTSFIKASSMLAPDFVRIAFGFPSASV